MNHLVANMTWLDTEEEFIDNDFELGSMQSVNIIPPLCYTKTGQTKTLLFLINFNESKFKEIKQQQTF